MTKEKYKTPTIKHLKKEFAKVTKALDDMKCNGFCFVDKPCPIYYECRILDRVIISINERLGLCDLGEK